MTLEELLAALKEAEKASKADPSNKALAMATAQAQKAYDDKKAEQDDEDDDDEEDPPEPKDDPAPGDLDETKLDDKTKQYLAKLRKENASHRNKNKSLKDSLKGSEEKRKAILKAAGIEVDEESAEDKLAKREQELNQSAFRAAILESAVENGIGKDSLEFFEFLVSKAAADLEDGDELSDEQMAEIVAKAKKQKAPANTTVNGGKGKNNNAPAPSGDDKTVTLAKFVRMSMGEKSKLYESNKDLYAELVAEAKAKRMLI